MWTLLKDRVGETVRKFVPIRAVSNRQRPAWMTREILQGLKRKRRLWKKAKSGKGQGEYEEVEKKVKSMIRKAKRNFERRLADGNGGNSKPFYSYIKRKTKCRSNIGPLKNEAKETVADDQGMAELLNKFFGSVFTREDITIIPSADETETDIMQEVEVTRKWSKTRSEI
jgi:hypothetical protein